MFRRVSIAELQNAGVTIRPAEAVAIAQGLIDASRAANADPQPPFDGPPDVANVLLGQDGSIECGAADATFAVSEIAIFLDALLPYGTAGVPGSLRYTIARALLDVDAPPFDSLEDLSRTLARHERGPRADVIRGLVERTISPAIDRRRSDPVVADLRRQLREADARIYDQQLALDAVAAMTPPVVRTLRRRVVVALGLAGALTFIGSEWLQMSEPAEPVSSTAVGTGTEAPATPAAETPVRPAMKAVPHPAAEPTATDAPVLKQTVRKGAAAPPRPREHARGRKSLFHWMPRIAVRSDPL